VELYVQYNTYSLIPYYVHAKLLLNFDNVHVNFRLEPQNQGLKYHPVPDMYIYVLIAILPIQPSRNHDWNETADYFQYF